MRSRRPGTLALLATLVGFVASSCIGDGNSTQDPQLFDTPRAGSNGNGSAGENGASYGGAGGELNEDSAGAAGHGEGAKPGSGGSGGEPPAASGGGSARGGSDSAAGEGGSGATATRGGSGGTSGTSANGGRPDDAGDAGEAGAGGKGTGGEGPPPLTLCERLINPPDNSFDVTQGYRAATTRDCRVAWVTRLYLDEDLEHVFLNQMLRWNLELWGCGGGPPPERFGLLFREVPLTSADADALITLYMETTITMLEMSSDEIDAMRAMLDDLAKRVIERETDEFTDSHCATGAGGEAGAP